MEQIEVRILDRNFKLQVPAQERERLMRAVQIVDRKMREIREAGRAQGTDRIAVHAALQLVYEFLGREAAAEASVEAAIAVTDDGVAADAAQPAATPNRKPVGSTSDVVDVFPPTPAATSGRATQPSPPSAPASSGRSAGTPGRNPSSTSQTATASRAAHGRSDATKTGASKRDVVRPDDAAAVTTGDKLEDARIEAISNELEAEIRRQESLF